MKKVHSNVDLNVKSYKCTSCPISFTTESVLKTHVDKEHLNNCEPCIEAETFFAKLGLKKIDGQKHSVHI